MYVNQMNETSEAVASMGDVALDHTATIVPKDDGSSAFYSEIDVTIGCDDGVLPRVAWIMSFGGSVSFDVK
jgi:hypothetical protein